MKAIILTSNSYRHKYFTQVMSRHFEVVGIVAEPKINYYTNIRNQSKVVQKHFDHLKKCEQQFFGNVDFAKAELLELERNRINDTDVVDWALQKKPDIILLFGTAILKEGWLHDFQNRIINLHLGLSPYYRGSATLFWPFYYDEIEYVGATIHIAVAKVDAGDIIGRVRPNLEVGDDYYTINLKTMKETIDRMPMYIEDFFFNKILLVKQDLTIGRRCRRSDFTERTLNIALQNVGNGLSKDKLQEIKKKKINI